MFFPEFLYRLSQRDQQVTWLDPELVRTSSAISTTPLQADRTVPVDRCMILKHAAGQAVPTAAQVANDLFLLLVAQAGSFFVNLATDRTPSAAGVAKEVFWTGEILVPPGWRIRAFATFGGGAANQVHLDTAGILIPAANVQRV